MNVYTDCVTGVTKSFNAWEKDGVEKPRVADFYTPLSQSPQQINPKEIQLTRKVHLNSSALRHNVTPQALDVDCHLAPGLSQD